jgi:YD repeat-containing protein
MVNFPIEMKSVRNVSGTDYIIGYDKIDYATWSAHGIYLQNKYRSKIGTAGILRSTFNSNPSAYCQLDQSINKYDGNGFSVESQQFKGVPTASLIDGTICQRTASVLSANATQIAYNGFETNDPGNWTFNTSLNQYQSDSKTGKYSLLLQINNPISRSNLPSGDYVVTYYEKNGSAIFSLIGSASLTSTVTSAVGSDGWYLQKKIVHISSATDGVQLSGSCNLDELRLYPVTSKMSTMNYDSYGKIITETDVNLRSQFYEYDGSGRILLIRDHDHNVVKEYTYSTPGY